MSDINDDLRDLFKNIEENRPEPEMPTATEVYNKYTNTFLKTTRPNRLKVLFATAPLVLASAALVVTVIVLSNGSTPNKSANIAGASSNASASSEDFDSKTATAENSAIAKPSAAVQPSGAATIQSSALVSVADTRSEYIEVYSQLLDTLSGTENGLTAYNMYSSNYEKVSDYSKLGVVRSYVSLAKSLYENDTFPITDSIIEFECDYKDNNITYQENLMYLKSELNSESNYFEFEIGGNAIENGQLKNGFYLNLVVDYDFKMNTVNSYDLYFLNVDNNLVVNKYENKELYEAKSPTTDMVTYCNNERDKFYNESNSCDSIGDFSNEYKESMDSELGQDYFIN